MFNPQDFAAWQATQALLALAAAPTEVEALRAEVTQLRRAVAAFAGCLSDLQPGC